MLLKSKDHIAMHKILRILIKNGFILRFPSGIQEGAFILRATNFVNFGNFWDFHENSFTKNYQKYYCDTDCRLKRRLLLC